MDKMKLWLLILLLHRCVLRLVQNLEEEMVERGSRNHQSTAQPADQMMLILGIPLPFLPQKESLAQLAQERWEKEEA